MATAFVYSDKFADFSYGTGHPMRPLRLKLTRDTIKQAGLLDLPGAKLVEARKAADDEILAFHTPAYLSALKEADSGETPAGAGVHGLGQGDNPVFSGVFEWSSYSTGASVQAAELVGSGAATAAFNIAGGLHHAMADRASGFCYINDPVVAIKSLEATGKRVVYIDIDAHHGDGVEAAFYDTDRVLTISIHESGRWLFPGTGFTRDLGEGAGRGFAVNLPVMPGADDRLFTKGFDEIVPPFIEAFAPDIMVTQLGVDTFKSDPITHLCLTTSGFEHMLRAFRSFSLPWVALGGGGYDMDNVRRAWAIAWAVMNGAPVPADLLDTQVDTQALEPDESDAIEKALDKDVSFLLREVLPFVKG